MPIGIKRRWVKKRNRIWWFEQIRGKMLKARERVYVAPMSSQDEKRKDAI